MSLQRLSLSWNTEADVGRQIGASGRSLTVPLEWFPRLRDASEADRKSFELDADGYAIHWPVLDEDISVPGLLGLPD